MDYYEPYRGASLDSEAKLSTVTPLSLWSRRLVAAPFARARLDVLEKVAHR